MFFLYLLPSQPALSTLFLQLLGPGTPLGNGPVPVLGGNKPRSSKSSSRAMGTGARARARACHVWVTHGQGPHSHLGTLPLSLCNSCVDQAQQPLLCSQEQEHAVKIHKYLLFRESFFAMTQNSFPLMPHQDPRGFNEMGARTWTRTACLCPQQPRAQIGQDGTFSLPTVPSSQGLSLSQGGHMPPGAPLLSCNEDKHKVRRWMPSSL